MRTEVWSTIGSVAPFELEDATLELHWATQLVAGAGQTFAEPRDDDSHRAMVWDAPLRCLVGAPFAGPYPFRVAVRPEDLTLVLLDASDAALGSLPLAGRTMDEARAWLALGLATYMGGPPPVIETPEYDMPEHPVGGGAAFASGHHDERRALAALYGLAAEALGELVMERDDEARVRCWPHHFDIAALLTVERNEEGAATKTVGVGMAPMGGGYDSWYWYVTPWPYPDEAALPELEGPGSWHTEGWTGAVLTGETLVAGPAEFRSAALRKFIDVSVKASVAALA